MKLTKYEEELILRANTASADYDIEKSVSGAVWLPVDDGQPQQAVIVWHSYRHSIYYADVHGDRVAAESWTSIKKRVLMHWAFLKARGR